jgi:Tol biopolymer transport system component
LILSGLSAQELLKEPNTVSPRLAILKRQLQGGDSGALERFWQEPKRIILLQPIRLLTSDGRYEDAEPAPSLDGKRVIFSRVEVEGGGRRRLWIVAISGGPPRPLTPPDFNWDCTRPSWSRDGRWVAFRASREVNDSEHGGIWIMPASGGAPRQLTGRSHTEDDYYPQWFPDGRQLAVLRDVPGTESDVWVVGLDGTARRLTAHPAFDGKSTISLDGRWIAFPSERSGARNLWIMPVAEGESEARQVTFDGGRGPAWSRDGRWIAYGCPVLPKGYALCLKRVEGGPVIQVT